MVTMAKGEGPLFTSPNPVGYMDTYVHHPSLQDAR